MTWREMGNFKMAVVVSFREYFDVYLQTLKKDECIRSKISCILVSRLKTKMLKHITLEFDLLIYVSVEICHPNVRRFRTG